MRPISTSTTAPRAAAASASSVSRAPIRPAQPGRDVERPVRHGADRDPQRHGRCRLRRGVTTAAASTVAKSSARRVSSAKPAPQRSRQQRQFDVGDHLTRRERGLEVAEVEVAGGDPARALRTERAHPRAERERQARQLRRGVGVREAAADRAAVADPEVADARRRVGHDGQVRSTRPRTPRGRCGASEPGRRGGRRAARPARPRCRPDRRAPPAPSGAASSSARGSGRRRSRGRRRRAARADSTASAHDDARRYSNGAAYTRRLRRRCHVRQSTSDWGRRQYGISHIADR